MSSDTEVEKKNNSSSVAEVVQEEHQQQQHQATTSNAFKSTESKAPDSKSPSSVDIPAEDSPKSESKRPISGDVASLLREMEGGKESTAKLAARKATEAQAIKEMQDLKAQLPPGSRPAKPEEVQGRPIPPNSTPIIIPPGGTISLELLQKSVSMGLFPMPSPGATMLEILIPEDRPKLEQLQNHAMHQMRNHQQMRARAAHQQLHMMPRGVAPEHTFMDENILPDDAEQHLVGKKLESFEIQDNGFRIPDSNSFDSLNTIVDWNDNIHKLELQSTLTDSSFVEASKKLFAGLLTWLIANILCYLVMCPCGFKRTIAFIVNFTALWLYVKFYVRRAAAGYKCPIDYLQLKQKDKTAVVTGGSTSIGAEIVKQMFRQGVSKIFVIEKSYMLACQRLAAMKKQLIAENVDVTEWSNVIEAVTIDLSDLNEVFEFTKSMAARKIPVHFLVLNQSEFSTDVPDEKNVDKNFLSNYLGHFLLFKQLFAPISAVGGRVITTGFQFYAFSKNLDIHRSILREDDKTPFKQTTSFCNSKALQILVTKMFGQRLSTNVRKGPDGQPLPFAPRAMAMSFNPGIVNDVTTQKVMKHSKPLIGPIITFLMKLVGKTPLEGAQTAFKLLFAPSQLLKQGSYFNEGVVQKTYGPCNIDYPEIKNNVLKVFQVSNVMVLDHSFEGKGSQMNTTTTASSPTAAVSKSTE